YLENNITQGVEAEELAHETWEKANAFLETANSWSAVPTNIRATGFNERDDWPGYCISALDKGLADRDLIAVQHWARELAAATFWLEDLLRWRTFLFK